MKTIYAEAQSGKVVLKEKEIPAPGKGEVLLKAKEQFSNERESFETRNFNKTIV